MSLTDWIALVVEDEADSMELVTGLLEYHGVRCLSAGTAEQALTLLQTNTPTLMIVDLALPGMDGWSFLREVQRQRALDRIPRVAITAYHSAELANQAIEAGFDAYFPKPLEATSFVRELVGIVEG